MKVHHRFVRLSLVATLVLAGCTATYTGDAPSPSPEIPAVDLAAEEATIRELDRQWMEAVAARDVDAAASFFAPDGIQMQAHGPTVVGRDAIRAWFESWMLDTSMTNSFAPDVIEVAASGDLAYDRGTYRVVVETPEGPGEDIGKYVVIWKKIDGEWKVILDIANSDSPLPPLE